MFVMQPRASEVDELAKRGHGRDGQLALSDRAHTILPYHVLVDTLREQGAGAIGTTKRGVGPCYEDKAARRGITMGMLRDLEDTEKRVAWALEGWRPVIAALGGEPPTLASIMETLARLQPRIVPLLTDAAFLVDGALRENKNVLFEGAQGTLLDIDHGTYPFVTSSTATAAGACTGTGVGPTRINRVIGLVKAYTTRVGGGPFPTELLDATGDRLRKAGAEFGSVTGRPRRCGWLDIPALRYASRINGLDGLALTKLDVLTGLPELQVCVRYKTPKGETSEFPIDQLATAEPIYRSFKGWNVDLSGVKKMEDLPKEAREYIAFIEAEVGCAAILVSVGSRREETIALENPFEVARKS